jgi:hypothetical protein
MVGRNVCLGEDQSFSPDLFALDHPHAATSCPDAAKGKEQAALNMLHGINEIHHTLANWLGK